LNDTGKGLIMRRLLVLIIGLNVLLNCAGTLTTAPKDINYQRVIEVIGGRDTLYAKSLQWLAKTYTDSKEVIEYKDKDAGKIIGRGATTVLYNPTGIAPIYLNIRYAITIEVKDNKSRITFDQIYNPQSPAAPIWLDSWNRLQPKYKELVDNYAEYLEAANDDW
jgi:hypothetical protein